MRLPFVGLIVGMSTIAIGLTTFSACSSAGPRPEAGNTDNASSSGGSSSGTGSSSGSTSDATTDSSSTDAAQEAALPPSCGNTIRDGAETDVDCGGNVCLKCFDGKACIADTDCAGGACLNKVCVTPKCTDLTSNGDETDIDCGGAICARCTIGKRCKAGPDCVSGECVNSACACPAGMTSATKAGGNGAYCIDRLEVTKYLYEKFYNANVNVDDQIPACKSVNSTFFPRGAWPPLEDIPGLQPGQGKAFNYSLPVHYVDWCDAYAYCKWANKQLCGSVSGGPVAPAMADQADAGAWYNACSGGGNITWPYGNSFDNRCIGSYVTTTPTTAGPVTAQRSGFGQNQDESLLGVNNGDLTGTYNIVYNAGCAGATSDLYHMTGNIAEWEDSCDGTGANANCRVRGGSFYADGDASTLSCKGQRMEQRVPPVPDAGEDPLRDVGFRCCLY